MTETLFAIGAGEFVVGRTRFCDYPPEAASVPIVGGFTDPSIEAIVALAPTLVVGERRPGGRDLDADLRAKGIESFFPPMYTLAQIEEMVKALGDKLGLGPKAAAVAAAMHASIATVEADVSKLPKPRVLLLFDFHPLVAAGPGAFPNELLALAGAVNVVTAGGEYPTLSPEGVLALDPDIVIDGSAGAYSESPEVLLGAVPGLSALRALKLHAVVRLVTKTALRPGPRIGEGVAELASLVHPATSRTTTSTGAP
jgi:iron complex transport system substrate-binding protein